MKRTRLTLLRQLSELDPAKVNLHNQTINRHYPWPMIASAPLMVLDKRIGTLAEPTVACRSCDGEHQSGSPAVAATNIPIRQLFASKLAGKRNLLLSIDAQRSPLSARTSRLFALAAGCMDPDALRDRLSVGEIAYPSPSYDRRSPSLFRDALKSGCFLVSLERCLTIWPARCL